MYKRHKQLNPVQNFQLFCLESYRSAKGYTGLKALSDFKNANVFDFLASGYIVLHTQSKNYILSELDQYIIHHNGTLPRKHRNS